MSYEKEIRYYNIDTDNLDWDYRPLVYKEGSSRWNPENYHIRIIAKCKVESLVEVDDLDDINNNFCYDYEIEDIYSDITFCALYNLEELEERGYDYKRVSPEVVFFDKGIDERSWGKEERDLWFNLELGYDRSNERYFIPDYVDDIAGIMYIIEKRGWRDQIYK